MAWPRQGGELAQSSRLVTEVVVKMSSLAFDVDNVPGYGTGRNNSTYPTYTPLKIDNAGVARLYVTNLTIITHRRSDRFPTEPVWDIIGSIERLFFPPTFGRVSFLLFFVCFLLDECPLSVDSGTLGIYKRLGPYPLRGGKGREEDKRERGGRGGSSPRRRDPAHGIAQ